MPFLLAETAAYWFNDGLPGRLSSGCDSIIPDGPGLCAVRSLLSERRGQIALCVEKGLL